MDPKTLQMFRALLKLDEKTLPDSITPENLGKLVEKQKDNLLGNPEDIKKLQKKLSERDIELKKALDSVKDSKKKSDDKKSDVEKLIQSQSEQITKLTESIQGIHKTQRTAELTKKYPDILPEVFDGKSDEEIDNIVTKQREMNKKLYGDSVSFKPVEYEKEGDIDDKIKAIKNDDSKGSEQSAVEAMQANRERSRFAND